MTALHLAAIMIAAFLIGIAVGRSGRRRPSIDDLVDSAWRQEARETGLGQHDGH